MSNRRSLNDRIEKQNKEKRAANAVDDEPDDMDMLLERERAQALNRQRSVFDSATGNRAAGINTQPSVFERTALFHTDGSFYKK